MKRVLTIGGLIATAAVLAGALAAPVARAKELTGLKVCGASGCADSGKLSLGHHPPFSDALLATAPSPGPFYRVTLSIDDGAGTWDVYYVPAAGAVAVPQEATWPAWRRPEPPVAAVVRRLARSVEPFPAPRITAVTVGSKRVERPASYLELLRTTWPVAAPGGEAVEVVLESPLANPWTERPLFYYPANDVLVRGLGATVRLPGDLADDVEAARPLEASGGDARWLATGTGAAGALALCAAALAVLRRRRHPGRFGRLSA